MANEPTNLIATTPAPRTAHSVLDVVRRYWWFIALVLVVSVGATYVATKQQTETFSSSARVLLRTPETLSLFPLSATAPAELQRSADREQFFISSPEFVESVSGETPAGVSVSSRPSANELIFTARGEDPQAVADAANVWSEAYVIERHRAFVAEQRENIDFIENEVTSLDSTRTELRVELAVLEDLIADTDDPDLLSRLLVQKVTLESALQGQLGPVVEQINAYERQLANFEFVLRFVESDGISARVSRAASVPGSPVSPNLRRNLAVGALLGMALGFALPYLRLSLRDKVDERKDVSDAAALPVLSAIPSFQHESDQTIEVLDHPNSPASEHYQALLTAIEFAAIGEPTQSIFFTSAEPGEGKTTTAINVAALAAQYLNVIVVDADMRRPSLHQVTDLSDAPGLSEVLAGSVDFNMARQAFERDGTQFDMLTAGRIVNDPALLLRGPAWQQLLDDLFLYDMVIIDGPPVLAVTDALLIGRAADAQVLLVRWGKTERKTLTAASELLSTNGSRTLGAVVNRAPSTQSGYQYYGTYRSAPVSG